jgi:uncharacterized membrane protein
MLITTGGRRAVDATFTAQRQSLERRQHMRHFSIRPTLTLKGRKFKGLRGLSGKPTHPPLTDIPIAAYLFVGVFDLISFAGRHDSWSHEWYQAASFVLTGGALVSLATALTGFWDRWRSSEPGTQARRTVNTHATIMVIVTVIVLVDLGLRWFRYHAMTHPPVVVLVLSLVAAVFVAIGSSYGGTLVFEYGFDVETAGDHPVWHRSETDVFPGEHAIEIAGDGQNAATALPDNKMRETDPSTPRQSQ